MDHHPVQSGFILFQLVIFSFKSYQLLDSLLFLITNGLQLLFEQPYFLRLWFNLRFQIFDVISFHLQFRLLFTDGKFVTVNLLLDFFVRLRKQKLRKLRLDVLKNISVWFNFKGFCFRWGHWVPLIAFIDCKGKFVLEAVVSKFEDPIIWPICLEMLVRRFSLYLCFKLRFFQPIRLLVNKFL
jgi:hypothetical protein